MSASASSAAREPLFTRTYVVALVVALLLEQVFALLIQFPGYLTELGASEGQIGLLYSATAFIGLAMRPALGRAMDQYGRRRVLLVGGLGNAVTVGLLAFTSAFAWGLWTLFILHRTFEIIIFTASLTYASDIIPMSRRTQGLALYGLSGLIPIALGGVVGDVLIGAGGFDLLFVAAAGGALVSWALVWFLPETGAERSGTLPRRSFGAAFAQRSLLPVWAATLLFAIGLNMLFTFLRTFSDARELTTVGTYLLIYGLTAIAVRLASQAVIDRMPRTSTMTISLFVYGLSFGVLGAAESLAPVVVSAVIGGAAHGLLFPFLTAEVVNRARTAERGSAMAIFTALFDVGLLVGAPIVGGLIDRSGYTVGFGFVAVVLAVGALVFGWWDARMVVTREAPSTPQRAAD